MNNSFGLLCRSISCCLVAEGPLPSHTVLLATLLIHLLQGREVFSKDLVDLGQAWVVEVEGGWVDIFG